ncbi:hypothetical protein M9H77_08799 [Catharanthus roseus]|uniref:Uncharacterized protein n=1 Tax=Catharanthus roseus TaxID=4058 RepID=A0ACC0BZ43_CATRO|nr:hypothetical protein M9H77_08799 [Catharanthus roseus]
MIGLQEKDYQTPLTSGRRRAMDAVSRSEERWRRRGQDGHQHSEQKRRKNKRESRLPNYRGGGEFSQQIKPFLRHLHGLIGLMIWPSQSDNTNALQQVQWKLAQLEEIIGMEFEFHGFVANSLVDLDALVLDIRPSDVEVLAINSIFELSRLLSRLGAIDKMLNSIKAMRPRMLLLWSKKLIIMAAVFSTALHYYSIMFDSANNQDLLMSEVYIGGKYALWWPVKVVDKDEFIWVWPSSPGIKYVQAGQYVVGPLC